MSDLNQLIGEQIHWFVLIFTLLLIVLLIVVTTQGAKLRKLRKRYDVMMAGSGVEDLESLLIDLKMQADKLEEGYQGQADLLREVQVKLRGLKGKVGMKRYNAFGERGNDLSFSLAILDANRSGMVLTSLHNRDNSFIYAKPIQEGNSQYPLSPEEQEAMTLALQQE